MIHFFLPILIPVSLLTGCFASAAETRQGKLRNPSRGQNLDQTTTRENGPAETNPRAIERRAFNLINQYRRSLGLEALVWNEAIARQCRNHSQYMANRNTLSHDKFNQRINNLRSSMNVSAAAENVAMNYNMPDPALVARNGWIKSPGHHENIKGDYTHSGMGVARTADGSYYLTQIFVRY